MSATARRVLDRRSAMCSIRRVLVLVGFVLAWPVSPLHAQTLAAENQAADDVAVNDNEASTTELDPLVAHALMVHPLIRAAVDRVEAARAAIRPAGARPDPMLMAGVMNLPLSDPGFTDFMTMKTIGIGQVFPYPGKLGLRRRVAELELAASEARLEAVRLAVAEEVKQAYYDLAFLDHALEVLQNNERLLANLIQVTGARYGVGTGGQQDVLKARVEAARLAEEAVALMERRRAALARLNAALYRPSETPVPAPAVPVRIARAAVADDAGEILFTSATLGARAADSPLPPLIELQETAVR
ncbi:MAG: TolC family protein, partial [Pseudonocardiaceae bacterium]